MDNNKQDSNSLELNVLYVEDKPINQKVFALILEEAGCKVDLANNGQEGVDMAKNKHYDIIFMDIRMPVMDGLTASKIINENANPPPIVAVTAYYDIIEESEIIENGIVDVVSKPFSSQNIFEKIYYWVQEK